MFKQMRSWLPVGILIGVNLTACATTHNASTAVTNAARRPAGGEAASANTAKCDEGFVLTAYGCVTQDSCPMGSGMYANTCVPTIGGSTVASTCPDETTSTQYGCLPNNGCPLNFASYNGTCVARSLVGQASCAKDFIYTSLYGCLQQANCPSGYGVFNGVCVSTAPASLRASGGKLQCPTGFIKTQFDCTPQGSCPSNFGLHAGVCFPAIP